MTAKELWRKVRKLEDGETKVLDDYNSTRKFMLDNYGQDQDRHGKVVDESMTLYQMVVHLGIYYAGEGK